MRRPVLAFLLCSVIARGEVPANLQQGYGAIQPKDLKADLTFLASDPLEGRLSLTRGSEVAVQWIQSEFAKAGLMPLIGDNYLQTVPLWEYRPDREGSFLSVKEAGKEEKFRYPEAYGQFPENLDLSGP